ncbi:MAG: thiamine pyrophosphate-dependent enzyme, partial [Bifidobacterium mongoliense]|nr:thiamine pyrophosphate-dependent enzyme [Bifidobacterium mongoliense]
LLHDWLTRYPTTYEESPDGTLAPQWVVKELSAHADPGTIWVSGVGQHQMWASQFVNFTHPHTWISSGGLGTMGYGLPAAIGATVGAARDDGRPRPVWLIDGDGSFQMNSQELATAFLEHTPVKIAILNNSVFGMVRQWQTLFFHQHYSQTDLRDGEAGRDTETAGTSGTTGTTGISGTSKASDTADTMQLDPDVPDFVTLAQAYGCVGMRARTKEEAVTAIERANAINDRPVLIDFRVWKDAMVWPMIAAGVSNDEVAYRPGINPLHAETKE